MKLCLGCYTRKESAQRREGRGTLCDECFAEPEPIKIKTKPEFIKMPRYNGNEEKNVSKELVDRFNAIPGVKPVKRFADTKTALRRIKEAEAAAGVKPATSRGRRKTWTSIKLINPALKFNTGAPRGVVFEAIARLKNAHGNAIPLAALKTELESVKLNESTLLGCLQKIAARGGIELV